MNSTWRRAVTVGITFGVTLGIGISVLLVIGWKIEKERTETGISLKAFGIELAVNRATAKEITQGGNPPLPNVTINTGPANDVNSPYVGGNYVSKSTIRYVIDDDHGQIEMYGYDVMRGRRVHVGTGRMEGKRLIIPNFYSFLDDTYGTLKLDLSEDNKSFEGRFEGNNPAQENHIVLVRLP
jgi:hypothetical protein